MGEHKSRYNLPDDYYTEIGRLITRWAFLEFYLRELAYLILDLSRPEGRIALREPRLTDYLTMLRDLMALKKLRTSIPLKSFEGPFRELQAMRDAIAHGVWVHHPTTSTPVLQVVAGKTVERPGGPAIKARILPKSLEMPFNHLRLAVNAIGQHTADFEKIRCEIVAQLVPSRDKRLQRENPAIPKRRAIPRSPGKRQRPPRS